MRSLVCSLVATRGPRCRFRIGVFGLIQRDGNTVDSANALAAQVAELGRCVSTDSPDAAVRSLLPSTSGCALILAFGQRQHRTFTTRIIDAILRRAKRLRFSAELQAVSLTGVSMPSSEFKKALSRELPILFVNIGWGTYYNGTETITGNHKHFRENPGSTTGESRAFVRSRGFFRCGIGYGKVPSTLHIVYVARNRQDKQLKAVGIYASATADKDEAWAVAKSDLAERIPVERRPDVSGWPPGQGMRRWALKNGKAEHQELLKFFKWLTERLTSAGTLPNVSIGPAEDDEGHEGDVKQRLVKHRRRESRMRNQKITDVLHKNNDRLICEVPNCGFDFHAKYKELGTGFAEVHHNKPLSEAPRKGRVVRLADLAIVCANCHRMIHRGGQCRPLANLIPREK